MSSEIRQSTQIETEADRVLRGRAQLLVLALLLGTMIVGMVELREISPANIPLNVLPAEFGSWRVASDEMKMDSDGSYMLLQRTYQNDEGQQALLWVQATYTRLGSLRDWSLAATAGGWTPVEEHIWQVPGGPMDVRMQHLQKRNSERFAATWYTSARSQTPSLKRAQLLAWGDRLRGDRRPWASMYLLLPVETASNAEESGQEIVAAIGPQLRELMATTRPGACEPDDTRGS